MGTKTTKTEQATWTPGILGISEVRVTTSQAFLAELPWLEVFGQFATNNMPTLNQPTADAGSILSASIQINGATFAFDEAWTVDRFNLATILSTITEDLEVQIGAD